jgi:DnaJ-class molecular chaperone
MGGDRTDALLKYLGEVAPDIDLTSYYQLLEVGEDATPDAVREAFYAKAGALHPDRYPSLVDPTARERLVTVYARITEAYHVLSDARKRAEYNRGLPQGVVRFGGSARPRKGPRNPEDALSQPQAKRFLRLALQAQQAGDLKGAAMNLRFAQSFEPSSQMLGELLAQVEEQLKAQAPAPEAPK